jgi:hypothetical protein
MKPICEVNVFVIDNYAILAYNRANYPADGPRGGEELPLEFLRINQGENK